MSKFLLSIDPGVHAAGAALWCDGKLVKAGYVEGSPITGVGAAVAAWALEKVGGRIELAVIEKPQIYTGINMKVDAGDLIDVAVTAGAIAGAVGAVETRFVQPKTWKGQIPKPDPGETYIIELRARKRLSVEEMAGVVLPKTRKTSWDLWDGVGVGLVHLRRM